MREGPATGSCGTVEQRWLTAEVMRRLGGGYAAVFGINLASMESDEVFKWFLASLLLGSGVGDDVARRTYSGFEKLGVVSPEAVQEAGWLDLIDVLARCGCGGYGFRIADKLVEAEGALREKYDGDLNRLHFFAEDERDLEKRLRGLAKGIGPVTLNIFLRELRGLWEKAEPPLSESVLLAARNLGLTQAADATTGLADLRTIWEEKGEREGRLSDFEVALARLGRNYCRKKRCSPCPVRPECSSE
ncbi:MAG: hypothetical protein A2Y91_07225 [Chloroflexi bacterium RBG_13_54_8]|nr:MAG: hypothetical protein A2Y91_07225 [Chloroflexi bacterium RBG_13_54_8]